MKYFTIYFVLFIFSILLFAKSSFAFANIGKNNEEERVLKLEGVLLSFAYKEKASSSVDTIEMTFLVKNNSFTQEKVLDFYAFGDDIDISILKAGGVYQIQTGASYVMGYNPDANKPIPLYFIKKVSDPFELVVVFKKGVSVKDAEFILDKHVKYYIEGNDYIKKGKRLFSDFTKKGKRPFYETGLKFVLNFSSKKDKEKFIKTSKNINLIYEVYTPYWHSKSLIS
ncbi:hypothetical protein A2230_00270 [candidate division WOR-1 bacterium RIFOXYA2_FULL_36_21]|uniref:DUF4352 domain-containing protein n=1 Tax=candidate division WOR-1 bacterium RIFOXYB2_FULL_36_35 TaxID=1802578 RepID=A0A1F4S1Y1_UNCSA|nr:MAG: hypothetical protein A2230_00270 [candidate division WOR-1 bacterium RIFOXYA2_FULL_36_21]OGC13733.1 MAG: hypothetical protein A2290_07660 [candidate division WOR-1 bacterium RIFOXYB2_FULL_36_35]OGC16987.1 MAG: hypothetical protein A2282_06270 [candidate division WOR-1 bacterium RIFOXYA12_FULL_36_13]